MCLCLISWQHYYQNQLKLAIIGQSLFGQEVYSNLRKQGHKVVGVFTVPDKDGKADPLGEFIPFPPFFCSSHLHCLYITVLLVLQWDILSNHLLCAFGSTLILVKWLMWCLESSLHFSGCHLRTKTKKNVCLPLKNPWRFFVDFETSSKPTAGTNIKISGFHKYKGINVGITQPNDHVFTCQPLTTSPTPARQLCRMRGCQNSNGDAACK